ncbi:MAG: type II toxin-antitoxin system VapC family toxin [Pirellulaceae bacterium]
MYVLDSDHMSLLEWGGQESLKLRERLVELPESEVVTTIVCYEEQIRGWMAYIARANSIWRQLEAYRRLRVHLENYRHIRVLDFDETAANEFQRLRHARVRIGTMDLKIAAIVLSRDETLLSRNLVDFGKIPELKVEDWTS